MVHLSPACEEILAVVDSQDEPTVNSIYETTTRPKELIDDLISHQLKIRYVRENESGVLYLTDSGKQVASNSQFST